MICPKCSRDNQDGSAYCSHCGAKFAEAPKKSTRWDWQTKVLVTFGVILLASMMYAVFFPHTAIITTDSSRSSFDPTLKRMLENWQEDGVLSVEHELNKVFVDPRYWNKLDAEKKKWLAVTLAGYCQATGPNGKWVKIYDKQSAKKLAEYDAWGVEVY